VRDHFSITITDVHGSRNYSLHQVVRKFVKFFILFVFLLISGGAAIIWWLNQETIEIENKRLLAKAQYQAELQNNQAAYIELDKERRSLQDELDSKSKQVQFLDQTLQGLEDLIGVKPQEDAIALDRVKLIQQSTLEKQIMLTEIPNGRPVESFKGVSSSYGWRMHPVKGKREFHRGIDYRGHKGDGIVATADAVVEYAGHHKRSGYGKMIILSHSYGFKTLYGHLSRLDVETGQSVKKGDVIGGIGSTGLSSGNHLHYEVSFVQRKLNPAHFIEWDLKNYNQIFEKIKGVPWGSLAQKVKSRVNRVEKQLLLRDVD